MLLISYFCIKKNRYYKKLYFIYIIALAFGSFSYCSQAADDGMTGENDCAGNAMIRTMATMALPVSTVLPAGGEVVYVGMYGSANGNRALPGHVLSMTYNAATSVWSTPVDLTVQQV